MHSPNKTACQHPLAHPPRGLYDTICEAALRQHTHFTVRSMSGLLWALAKSRHYHKPLYKAAGQHLTAQIKLAAERKLPRSRRSRPKAGRKLVQQQRRGPSGGEEEAGGNLTRGLDGSALSPMDVVDIAMAFAAFNHLDPPLFRVRVQVWGGGAGKLGVRGCNV